MPNQPSETFHCQEYLRKCGYFSHERNQITTWRQVKAILRGEDLDEVINMQTSYTRAREASDEYTPPKNLRFDLDYNDT